VLLDSIADLSFLLFFTCHISANLSVDYTVIYVHMNIIHSTRIRCIVLELWRDSSPGIHECEELYCIYSDVTLSGFISSHHKSTDD